MKSYKPAAGDNHLVRNGTTPAPSPDKTLERIVPVRAFREFNSAQDARDYRHEHGTGGWIFAPANGPVILFPPDMSPQDIFCHRITAGLSGDLIGSA